MGKGEWKNRNGECLIRYSVVVAHVISHTELSSQSVRATFFKGVTVGHRALPCACIRLYYEKSK